MYPKVPKYFPNFYQVGGSRVYFAYQGFRAGRECTFH